MFGIALHPMLFATTFSRPSSILATVTSAQTSSIQSDVWSTLRIPFRISSTLVLRVFLLSYATSSVNPWWLLNFLASTGWVHAAILPSTAISASLDHLITWCIHGNLNFMQTWKNGETIIKKWEGKTFKTFKTHNASREKCCNVICHISDCGSWFWIWFWIFYSDIYLSTLLHASALYVCIAFAAECSCKVTGTFWLVRGL